MPSGNRMMWALVLALGMAGTASADTRSREKGQVKVFLKGGAGNYTGGLANFTHTGPTWGLTLNVQPLHFLGFEAGYEGGYNGIDLGPLSLGGVTRHGASALAKLSLPFIEVIKPFVAAGIGGSYRFVNESAVEYRSGLVGEVPLVAGVEFNAESVTAGVRATYRLLLGENLSNQIDRPSGGFFDVALTLGLRF